MMRERSCGQPSAGEGESQPDLVRARLVEALPELRRYAQALVQDRAAADDLVQATAARALAKAHHYRSTGPVMGWLIVMMRNLMRDDMRRRRHAHDYVRSQLRQTAALAPPQLARLELRDLSRAYGQLNEAQRRVLSLIAVDGRSYEEAALSEGVAVGTIRSRASRARDRLTAATN